MRAILTALILSGQLLLTASGVSANDLNFAVFSGPPAVTVEPIDPAAFHVFVAPQPVVVQPMDPAAFAVFSYPAPAPRPEPKPQPIKPPPAASPVAAGVPHCGYYFDPYDGRLKWRCFY